MRGVAGPNSVAPGAGKLPSQNFYEILKTRMSVDLWAMASFDVYQSTVAFIVHYTARLVWAHLTLAKCPH
jgi:hypothetical protein